MAERGRRRVLGATIVRRRRCRSCLAVLLVLIQVLAFGGDAFANFNAALDIMEDESKRSRRGLVGSSDLDWPRFYGVPRRKLAAKDTRDRCEQTLPSIVNLIRKSTAGMDDMRGALRLFLPLVLRFDAQLFYTRPCDALSRIHNHKHMTSCHRKWADYFALHINKKVWL